MVYDIFNCQFVCAIVVTKEVRDGCFQVYNTMDANQRLKLQSMIAANDVEDQTEFIRSLKHSAILRADVAKLVELRQIHAGDPEILHAEGMAQCEFLATYYTDIFNKIRKDNIDLEVLDQVFDALEDIESGRCDQHDASFKVGTLLKKIYVDSALRAANKLEGNRNDADCTDAASTTAAAATMAAPAVVDVSWSQWKNAQQQEMLAKLPRK